MSSVDSGKNTFTITTEGDINFFIKTSYYFIPKSSNKDSCDFGSTC